MAGEEQRAALSPQADDFCTLVKAEKARVLIGRGEMGMGGVWGTACSVGLHPAAIYTPLFPISWLMNAGVDPSHPTSPLTQPLLFICHMQVSIVVGGEAPQASAVTIVNDQTQVRILCLRKIRLFFSSLNNPLMLPERLPACIRWVSLHSLNPPLPPPPPSWLGLAFPHSSLPTHSH